MVQVAANFVLPGCSINITDLSFFAGPKAALYAELGYAAPEPEPEEPPEEPIDITEVKARLSVLEAWKKRVQEA
jgi:hypothetical protein